MSGLKILLIIVIAGAIVGCATTETRSTMSSLFETEEFAVSIARSNCELLSATYTDKSKEGSGGAHFRLRAFSQDEKLLDEVDLFCGRTHRGRSSTCAFEPTLFDPRSAGGADCPSIDRLVLRTIRQDPYTVTYRFGNDSFRIDVQRTACFVNAAFLDLSGRGSSAQAFTLMGVSDRNETLDTIRLVCGPVVAYGSAICAKSKIGFDQRSRTGPMYCSAITSIELR